FVTRACIPLLRKAPHGHIVNISSIAGFETYKGGAGYTSVKHAVRAITRTLRLELNGEPIRITEIAPGLVETEFSIVRFKGDKKASSAVYSGLKPLSGADIADRSEEHTSELQSRGHLVCRLLLEKKKKTEKHL